MSAKKPAKKAPAEAGAVVETPEQMRARKRAQAAINRAALAAYHEQQGKGIGQVYAFIDAYEAFKNWGAGDDEGFFLEEFLTESKRVVAALKRYLEHEAGDLDEAFGVKRPGHYSRPQARKRFERMFDLQRDGRILRQHGAKASPALFEVLGQMHGVGYNTAAEWYYERNKGIKPIPGKSPADLPRKFEPYIGRIDWPRDLMPSVKRSGKT